jgi:hypothetical protein
MGVASAAREERWVLLSRLASWRSERLTSRMRRGGLLLPASMMKGPAERAGLVVAFLVLAGLCAGAGERAGATVPGGTNILHVPMSWCILQESPAWTSPNVMDEVTLIVDSTTDSVIWRRHERPTDHVYTPLASISLRSAINNTWGGFTFPHFADPLTDVTTPGDVRSDLAADTTALYNACQGAYAAAGHGGIGITAINANRFEDASGAQINQTGFGMWSINCPAGVCTYEGSIYVTDNHYLYPTVPGHPFFANDPYDEVVAHETGHALGLNHSTDTTDVMYPTARDNNGDGRIDNLGLSAAEVTTLRASAMKVPGLEIDPAGNFVPGPILSMRRMTGPRKQTLAANLNLAALTVSLNQSAKRLIVGQRLWGLLPCRSTTTPVDYDYLLDLDNKPATGASQTTLTQLGIPVSVRGADLIARATIVGSGKPGPNFRTCQQTVKAWVIRDGSAVPLPRSLITIHVQTVRTSTPDNPFPPFKGRLRPPRVLDLFNTLDFSLPIRLLPTPIRAKVPFRAGAVLVANGKPRDRFPIRDRPAVYVLQAPSFPHCYPAGTAKPGGSVPIKYEGLRPNREIHALLGPQLVLRGVNTDANGAGQIQFPIPRNASPGNHLVTIGHDGLALTADCTLTVGP